MPPSVIHAISVERPTPALVSADVSIQSTQISKSANIVISMETSTTIGVRSDPLLLCFVWFFFLSIYTFSYKSYRRMGLNTHSTVMSAAIPSPWMILSSKLSEKEITWTCAEAVFFIWRLKTGYTGSLLLMRFWIFSFSFLLFSFSIFMYYSFIRFPSNPKRALRLSVFFL